MKQKLLLILLNVVFSAYSQNAALDPTFGNAGISVHPHPHTAEIRCFAFYPNGNIISAGYALQGATISKTRLILTKTDKNGILDTSFGINGKVTTVIGNSEYVIAIAIQPDGKIIATGQVNLPGGINSGFVCRYNNDGSLDTSFATNGIYTSPVSSEFSSVMVLSNGSIIFGGNTYINNDYLAIIVKLNSNGTEDINFGTNGVFSLTSTNFKFIIQEAILLNNGSIFCLGYEYSDTVNHSKSAYCKIDTQGNFDTTFGTNGKIVIDLFNYNPISNLIEYLHTARELTNGQIIIAGSEQNQFMAKVNTDGTLDNTFGNNGIASQFVSMRHKSMVVQPDGKIIIGSGTGVALGAGEYRITRFDSNGNLDTTFNNGKGMVDIDASAGDDWANHIKLQANDTLIIGGFSNLNSVASFTLARVLLDTPLSIEEPLEQFIKLYPNPFNDRLFVEDFEGIIKNIRIFDNTGRIIKTISNSNNVKEIYTDFSSGIYNITVETKDGRIMNKKMIKK